MRKTVTIGIPAYQSEENIKKLLLSLLAQKQNQIRIKKIIIYVDGSSDNTAKVARSIKSKRIQVINSRKNKGFAFALQSIISKNDSDIFVGLNDDIRLDSDSVIEEITKPFSNKKVGLVGGNIVALPPRTFIGRCIYASYLAFAPLRYSINNGKSDLSCDGKILALSKKFAQSLNLKKTDAGNVDIFLYYENLKQGYKYSFAKKAEVKFRLPETIKDFKSQEARSEMSRKLVQTRFKDLFVTNHNFSKVKYIKSVVSVFIKYPLETLIFKLLINSFLPSNKKGYHKWKLALTTKKLGILMSELSGF